MIYDVHKEGDEMARINAAKKEEIRNKIVDVADRLFLEEGYDEVSTAMIAKNVGVAEGTVFNYFKSKAELYWVCIAERYSKLEIDPRLDFQACLEDLLFEATFKHIDFLLKLPRKAVKEMFGVALEFAKKSPSLFKKLMDMDYRYMDTTKEIFLRFQEKGLLKCDRIDYLTDIFFGTVAMEFMLYVYDENYDQQHLEQALRSKIKFLLLPYGVNTEL